MSIEKSVTSLGVGQLTGKKAWRQNLGLAAISAGKVESALGPRGAYKMVTFNRGPEKVIKVTKDGVEILKELQIQYPAVKTISEAAKLQREDVGDGVSTLVVILAKLLKESESLMDKKIHPNVILKGYRSAAKECLAVLDKAAAKKGDIRKEILDNADCGRGLLTPLLREQIMEACDRAASQGGIDLKRIRIMSKSGAAVADSQLIKGVVVRKQKTDPSMPDEVRDLKVAVVNKAFDNKALAPLAHGVGNFAIKLEVTDEGQMKKFMAEERRLNDELVDAVDKLGVKAVFCRAKIIKPVADEMSRRGIIAFEILDQQAMDDLCEATGATAIGDIRNIQAKDLGHAHLVKTEKFDTIWHFIVEADKGSTIVIRGSSLEDIAETERVLKNVVRLMKNAAKDARTVPGGAAVYMQMVMRLRELALETPGREQAAIEAFANSLEQVAVTLISNYGVAWSKVLPELRSLHAEGHHEMGIAHGGCVDMDALGVRDLLYTEKSVIRRVYDVASLLLRVDQYFYVKELPLVHKQA